MTASDHIPRPSTAEPVRRLKVIGSEPLSAVLDIAVSRALRRHLRHYDARQVGAFQALVRREFGRLVRENARDVRGISRTGFLDELARTRDKVLVARDKAAEDLEELRSDARLLHNLRDADQRMLRQDTDERVTRHRAVIEKRIRDLLVRFERGELDAGELRAALADAATEEARNSWEQAIGVRLSEHDREAENYQRRIAKLQSSLERTETALNELSKVGKADEGLTSIYRTVQGLAEDVENHDLKQALLAQIYEANVILQKASDAGDVEASAALAAGVQPPPPSSPR